MHPLLRILFYKFWIKQEKRQHGGEELGPEWEQGKEAGWLPGRNGSNLDTFSKKSANKNETSTNHGLNITWLKKSQKYGWVQWDRQDQYWYTTSRNVLGSYVECHQSVNRVPWFLFSLWETVTFTLSLIFLIYATWFPWLISLQLFVWHLQCLSSLRSWGNVNPSIKTLNSVCSILRPCRVVNVFDIYTPRSIRSITKNTERSKGLQDWR